MLKQLGALGCSTVVHCKRCSAHSVQSPATVATASQTESKESDSEKERLLQERMADKQRRKAANRLLWQESLQRRRQRRKVTKAKAGVERPEAHKKLRFKGCLVCSRPAMLNPFVIVPEVFCFVLCLLTCADQTALHLSLSVSISQIQS